MAKKIDVVQLMREIRDKLGAKYAASRDEEVRELEIKFGHLKKRKDVTHAK